ncbi:unnamed protein product [Mycena citricolor]|uniref:Non-specific serine/threonine protein kinase n=1 Tax=Mycena citricolor TaxID=2018698 RepID=A0AAD2GT34_9AGAR|nr:unnamed protein product [Mycena citricolor]
MDPPARAPRQAATSVAVGTPRHRERERVASHHHHQTPTSSKSAAPATRSSAAIRDVLAHPAVVAFVANHPKRGALPKFGSYYMLQTLGEGEFGKVKLGIHCKYGEEAAVKLIRRESVHNESKMAKIAREIEILDSLRHPNIVRLYDVFETDKFFGIILEYAAGGELFDHILAHRHLKERDAARLFAQLVSGVWYMHQKNIVHRDLKLENLLLDRNRNLVITDFGFANQFQRKDLLMETMCGSPCYAAPELVMQEGSYVGTAADVWSCGVILYAMLSGYLPFDDDPDNPDAENISKLYAYISKTPVSFAEHVSDNARDLLCLMLVPNPVLRCELVTVMRHPWFQINLREATTFGLTVAELEKLAEDGATTMLAYRRAGKRRKGVKKPVVEDSPSGSEAAFVAEEPRTRHTIQVDHNTQRRQRAMSELPPPDAKIPVSPRRRRPSILDNPIVAGVSTSTSSSSNGQPLPPIEDSSSVSGVIGSREALPGTMSRSEARALLHPLIVDSSSSSPPVLPPKQQNKVMQWFRRGRRSTTTSTSSPLSGAVSSSPPPQPSAAASSVEVAQPFLVTPGTEEHRQRTSSAVSITSLFRRSQTTKRSSKSVLRVHHGAVDHEMITASRPPEVMQHIREVLLGMGVSVQSEGEFKFRSSFLQGSRVFRGLMPRRAPSPARSIASEKNGDLTSPVSAPEVDAVYGEPSEDIGDEVRFSVELTRLDRLKDMYSMDIRRLKGNLKSYKFLYETLRIRTDLQRH